MNTKTKVLKPSNCVEMHLGEKSLSPIICKNSIHARTEEYVVVTKTRGFNYKFDIALVIPPGYYATVSLSSVFQRRDLVHSCDYNLFQGYIRTLQLFIHALDTVIIPRGTTICEVSLHPQK
ncbi:E4 34K [bottlenose dolphin adenovirus 2]|uniref:E4 34K n=1 Tax=bottlenose dolphin adenovirus 2 TaxID=2849592 RepID=A0A0M4M234_9ADEN|nr:E4 34K [Bottlenose dolphin adenovirus 1]ALE15315.1 E4 34K [Bottlenose dolphin adenovirus 1]